MLALCLPEVYAARAPFGEPLVQVLLLGGLCLFIDALEVRSSAGDRGRALAGLGGVALGLTVLVSAASFGVLLPVIPVVMVLLVARHPAGLPFGLGLLGGAGTGVAAGKVLASSYLAGFSAAQGRLLDVCVGGFCLAAGLAVPLVHPGPRSRVRRVCLVNVRLPWFGGSPVVLPSLGGVAQWLALVLPAVVLVGLAERPFVRILGGQLSGLRHYQQFGVYWAAWYLGVPALLLACAGAAALGRRAVRAVLDGGAFASGAPGTPLRLWALPLLVVFWSSVTVLWDPFEAPWQPSASRRLVPVVLPGLVLLAVWALSWLASHAAALGASRRVVAAVAGCCVLAVAVPGAVTTLGPTVTASGPYRAGRFRAGHGVGDAAGRAGRVRHRPRVGRRGRGAVRVHRVVGERAVHRQGDGGAVRADGSRAVRGAGRGAHREAGAGGALRRAGGAAAGAARADAGVGVAARAVRVRGQAGGLAADRR